MFGKPRPKRKNEFVISEKNENDRHIKFGASKHVLPRIKENNFGTVTKMDYGYVLVVDLTFDFNEVAEYLESFKQ